MISLDPSALQPATETEVNYASLIHYCKTLLDDALEASKAGQPSERLLSAHHKHHPPPAVWISGAVLLWGQRQRALLKQA